MSFQRLQIRYQTARSLPAPYAYFYTLSLTSAGASGLQVELAITYPDREDIDDDELIAEGFTRDDDFSWSGQLPKVWLETVAALVTKTRLRPLNEDELGEDDDFWEITVDTQGKEQQKGAPANADQWQYLVQELIQAAYEVIGREHPFHLTYLDLNSRRSDTKLDLTASFVDRNVRIVSNLNGQERSKTMPWATLQKLMGQVYEHDYDPEEALLKRPKRDGQWLNLGGEEWYDISDFRKLINQLTDLL
ncbi:hypothetical protein IC229_15160 [Spirosoma sp. BT702]|uniref:Uncharacterized protein n=1 Tax=Spirosoma profusum TaxID=2771354 RepID=A0A926Y131_9BACT|nr:hypothetical protein [Spirosoma profusum]MBD2701987.1 hypothetical protein [Spirosoma profusum]